VPQTLVPTVLTQRELQKFLSPVYSLGTAHAQTPSINQACPVGPEEGLICDLKLQDIATQAMTPGPINASLCELGTFPLASCKSRTAYAKATVPTHTQPMGPSKGFLHILYLRKHEYQHHKPKLPTPILRILPQLGRTYLGPKLFIKSPSISYAYLLEPNLGPHGSWSSTKVVSSATSLSTTEVTLWDLGKIP
jgi:hypothetical protein